MVLKTVTPGIEWSLRASASMRAECLFLRARAFDKQLPKFFASMSKQAPIEFLRAIRAKAKFCEHF